MAEKSYRDKYEIGKPGQARGIVFHEWIETDLTRFYVEAAPANTDFSSAWGPINIYVESISNFGRDNTENIVRQLGAKNSAAKRCKNLVINGFNDWFMPTIDELVLMYKNLKLKKLGGFKDDIYWSSTSINAFNENNTALLQSFITGNADIVYRPNVFWVRAARYFSVKADY